MAPINLGHPVNLAAAVVSLVLIYIVGSWLYNATLHPLRSYPGPLSHAISHFPRSYYHVKGTLPFHVKSLHEKYGPVVRIGPDELAFSSPEGWRDIYGHRSRGQPEFPKYEGFYRLFPWFPTNIITAPRDQHAAMRRQISHGFSERSMRGQEPIIGEYVDKLISRMNEACENPAAAGAGITDGRGHGSATLNLREFMNWATFDIIGDLAFGSPFGCLDKGEYHPWVSLIGDSILKNAIVGASVNIGMKPFIKMVFKSGLMRSNREHLELTRTKVRQRLELEAERPDLIEGLIQHKDDFDSDPARAIERLGMNASLLIIAGSETTATLLSGALFLLTMNPDKLAALTHEVRSTFTNDEDITMLSTQNLPYMLACLNESLRMYPPVPIGLPRVAPQGGASIAGNPVPQGTRVSVWQWAVNYDTKFWANPEEFAPERFMGKEEKYKNDRHDAMQPFSTGPRNCVGKNLAYAEMRLILAKVVYNFDMSIDDSSRRWLRDQKAYTLWDKPALDIHMTPVKRGEKA